MTRLRLQTIFIQSQQSHKFRSHIHISSENRSTDLLPLLTKSRVLSKIWLFTLPSHLCFDSPYRAPTSIGLFCSITDTRSGWRPCSNQHHWYNSPSIKRNFSICDIRPTVALTVARYKTRKKHLFYDYSSGFLIFALSKLYLCTIRFWHENTNYVIISHSPTYLWPRLNRRTQNPQTKRFSWCLLVVNF